jgi:hypothetical protein
MRKAKVRGSSEAFDTECHGFTFPRETGGRVVRAIDGVHLIMTGFADSTAAVWPPPGRTSSDIFTCRGHIKEDCAPTMNNPQGHL